MTPLKRTLLILIPLAVIAVLTIAVIAVKLATGNQGDITYRDSAANGQSSMQAPVQQGTNVFTANPYNDVSKSTEDDLLTSWQDSNNIKQGDYAPRVSESIDIQDIIDTAKPAPSTEDTSQSTTQSPDDSGIWDWVPQTILRKPTSTPQEIPEMAEIKTYVNLYGNTVKEFTRQADNQTKLMEVFIAGRGEEGNTLEIQALAQQYITLSEDLTALPIPSGFESTAQDLSLAYKGVGEATHNLSLATDDTDTLQRLYAYNASVDIFATEFISFANLIGAYSITFTKGEGGDIFTPPVQ